MGGTRSAGATVHEGRGVTADTRAAPDAPLVGLHGLLSQRGQGLPQDDVEAARWYRLAADQGDADAQDALGLMYLNGLGVGQDHAEAARLFRRPAGQGLASAQANLGLMYANGEGVSGYQ